MTLTNKEQVGTVITCQTCVGDTRHESRLENHFDALPVSLKTNAGMVP
jgi:hypothetical protein